MAGSWNHMVTPKGRLLNNERFCGMIENGGDAYEAAEECFGMVWWLARDLARMTKGPQATRADMLALISSARAGYKEGLRTGGVQRDR